jgi:hypothetical protein
VRVAELVDGQPLDVLHDEVGQAVVGRSAVHQARDVGVVERGENLPLLPEAPEDEVCVHPALDELDGDALLELVVGANREVDRAHAAAPKLPHDAIRADAPPDEGRGLLLKTRVGGSEVITGGGLAADDARDRGLFDKGAGLLVRADELLDLSAQLRVRRALLGEVGVTLGGREVYRGVKDALYLLPAFRGHGGTVSNTRAAAPDVNPARRRPPQRNTERLSDDLRVEADAFTEGPPRRVRAGALREARRLPVRADYNKPPSPRKSQAGEAVKISSGATRSGRRFQQGGVYSRVADTRRARFAR